jgi:predicted dehydrogenase
MDLPVKTAEPLRGALLGAGFFAQHHAEAWTRLEMARIVAVVDPQPERAQRFAAQHGFPGVYQSLNECLTHEQLDFVDVVTGPAVHLELTRTAAAHGPSMTLFLPAPALF